MKIQKVTLRFSVENISENITPIGDGNLAISMIGSIKVQNK